MFDLILYLELSLGMPLETYLSDFINRESADGCLDYKMRKQGFYRAEHCNCNNQRNLYPVPCFGQLETADILTLGANPSADGMHFGENNYWPEWNNDDLAIRLICQCCCGYFDNNQAVRWFGRWNSILEQLDASYYSIGDRRKRLLAAHIDISPRPTRSMRACQNISATLWNEMMTCDRNYLHELLTIAGNARCILIAGTASRSTYVFDAFRKAFPAWGVANIRHPHSPSILWNGLAFGQRNIGGWSSCVGPTFAGLNLNFNNDVRIHLREQLGLD